MLLARSAGMSQTENLHRLFEENGGKLTLGQILEAYDRIGCKHTGRISELRQMLITKGFDIYCHMNRKRPTDTLYEIVPIQKYRFEGNQGVLI